MKSLWLLYILANKKIVVSHAIFFSSLDHWLPLDLWWLNTPNFCSQPTNSQYFHAKLKPYFLSNRHKEMQWWKTPSLGFCWWVLFLKNATVKTRWPRRGWILSMAKQNPCGGLCWMWFEQSWGGFFPRGVEWGVDFVWWRWPICSWLMWNNDVKVRKCKGVTLLKELVSQTHENQHRIRKPCTIHST